MTRVLPPMALALAAMCAGCLIDRDDAAPQAGEACRVFDPFLAHQYKDAYTAPTRQVGVRFLHLGGPIVFAWESEGAIHAIGNSAVVSISAPLPAGRDITVLAGVDDDERWAFATVITAGTSDVHLDIAPTQVAGELTGTWATPAAIGPLDTAWQPQPLPLGPEGLSRMQSIDLELQWSNGAAGGADFGIAVGPLPEGGFHYTNADYQATPGTQRETRTLTADQFLGWGWDDRAIEVGPSVSTGAFATTGIEYTLTWTAHLASHAHDGRVCTSTDGA